MKKFQFEIGYKDRYESLYGGCIDFEVISRTENTVTFREYWVAEDTRETCHDDTTYDIQIEESYGCQIEWVAVWEYCGHVGHQYCINDNKFEEIRNEFNKEENTMTTNTTFELNGITYRMNTETNRYSKTVNGRTTRIGKAEFEAAQSEYDLHCDAEELERYLQEQEESNTDEEIATIIEGMDADAEDDSISAEEFIEKVQKVEKEKKIRKERKAKAAKKNAYHTSTVAPGVTLTEKQVDFILHLSDSNFWENGLDSILWVDVLCDEIRGQFEGKPMTVGAMISTLCEKGLGSRGKDRVNGRKCTSFALTAMGKQVAAELGLN